MTPPGRRQTKKQKFNELSHPHFQSTTGQVRVQDLVLASSEVRVSTFAQLKGSNTRVQYMKELHNSLSSGVKSAFGRLS